jgi:predicted DNA-binding ribbon-helix-helix protein
LLKKRSFSLSGHRTSVALEDEFWDVLQALAVSRGTGLTSLVASIDAARSPAQSLASALRLAALREAYNKPGV